MFVELGVPEPVPDRERWWLEMAHGAYFVEVEGQPAAYAAVFPRGDSGHVLHLVVAPGWRGRGLGRLAMTEAARRLREVGCRRWYLNVKEDNQPALALYRRMGLAPAYAARALRVGEDIIGTLPAARGVKVRVLAPSEAVEAERRFAMPPGVLLRKPGVALCIDRAAELAGVARFVIERAHASPFRVVGEDLVRPLLEAMHRLAPELPFVRLVVEADADLAAWLCKMGGVEELRLLHLTGELPAG